MSILITDAGHDSKARIIAGIKAGPNEFESTLDELPQMEKVNKLLTKLEKIRLLHSSIVSSAARLILRKAVCVYQADSRRSK